MKTYIKPTKDEWSTLIERPSINEEQLSSTVVSIIDKVKEQGDKALYNYAEQFDGVSLNDIQVSANEIQKGVEQTPEVLKEAIQVAYANISKFHQGQKLSEEVIVEKVGLYIPGGTAPLFSTILMLGIPAMIAGCKEIIICTPPSANDQINPAILYTAHLVGITKVYKVGGAQAIAAMAYGTDTIPNVYKIFGPGNQYVTKAKEIIQRDGVAIDMPAGPSEVLVIADKTCIPSFVAADLLSQAEHGIDSQVILLSSDEAILNKCLAEVTLQVQSLPRKEIALKALSNSKAIVLSNTDECMSFSNRYAPEHLILASTSADELVSKVANAGSVFIGNYSCESAGDYASGTNHTLPTNGFAKNYSGVSLDSFVKKITFQELSKEGISNIGNAIEIMAQAEQLIAHKNAVSIRLKEINNG